MKANADNFTKRRWFRVLTRLGRAFRWIFCANLPSQASAPESKHSIASEDHSQLSIASTGPHAKNLAICCRFCLMCVAGVLLVFGLLKMVSPLSASAMREPDPVFSFLDAATVLFIAGCLEVAVAGWVLRTRGQVQVAKLSLLSLMLGITLYRVGLSLLAPGATCPCGGLGWVGVRYVNSLPGWVFTTVLASGVLALLMDFTLSHRQRRVSNIIEGMSGIGATKASLPLFLLFAALHPLPVLTAESVSSASLVLSGRGFVEIEMPSQRKTGERFTYPIELTVGSDYLKGLLVMPDGSKQQWLITNDVAMVVTFSASTFDRPNNSLVTNAGPVAAAAAVYPLNYSFPDIGPLALIWLAFYGAEHSMAGGYLKPPHFLATEPAGWLMEHTLEQGRHLAKEVEFQFKPSPDGIKRADRFLPPDFPRRSEILGKLKAGISRYSDGFIVGKYKLTGSARIANMELPSTGWYQSYIPAMSGVDGVITNVAGNYWNFSFNYSANGAVGDNLVFSPPIDVQDARTRLIFGTDKAGHYKVSELTVIATNDPVFLKALISATGITESEFSRRVTKSVILGALIVLALIPIFTICYGVFRSKHPPHPKNL